MQEFERKEKREGKVMGYIFMGLGIFLIVAAITYIILGYFVSFTGGDGEIYDGLNRLLDEVPPALNLILRQWAGHIWFIIDCLVLLGVVVVTDKIFVKSKNYLTGIKNVDF